MTLTLVPLTALNITWVDGIALTTSWITLYTPSSSNWGTGLRARAFSTLKILQSLRVTVQSPRQLRLSLLCVPPDPQFNDTLSEAAAAMVPNSTRVSRKAARLIKLIKEFSCMEIPPSHTFPQNALSHNSAAAIKPLPPPARLSSHRVTLGQAAVDCRGQSAPHMSLEVISQSLAG